MKHGWRSTAALVRCGLGSLSLVVLAVVVGRPDLLVLAVPLLVFTAGGIWQRPAEAPRLVTNLVHSTLREGEGTAVRATLTHAEGVEHAVMALSPHRFVAAKPPTGVRGVTVIVPAVTVLLDAPIGSMRWGRRSVGDGLVAATSAWGGFRWGPVEMFASTLTTLPMPGHFDSRAPTPHPVGLVGINPARRIGDGTAFASIRRFTAGDRLKRVQWRVSLRTGNLHVTSTLAEEDSSILLIVDAVADIGVSGGTTGPSSSLDVAVRAAGAVAEHYLRRGDRVGLRVLGTTKRSLVAMGAGNTHLRRVLDTLAQIVPGATVAAGSTAGAGQVDPARMQFGASAGTTVIMLSPMLSDEAISATVTLARRGLSVIVVDTIPEHLDLGEPDPKRDVAWRLRMLERDGLLRKVAVAGIPVVAWRGPGTLDEVLRKLGRRAAMPRMVRR